MREQRKTGSLAGATLAIVLGAVAAHGCAPSYAETTTKAQVDAKADELLRKMSATLAGAKGIKVDTDHVLEVVKKDGEKLQFTAESRVAVERPNKVRTDRIGPVADLTFRYDGNQLSIFGNRTKMYATSSAPPTIDGMIDYARDTLGIEAPAADLLYKDPYSGLMEDVVSGSYVGLEPVGDRMCHHLAYRGHETDWQIWVEDNAQALPCRYVITSKNVTGGPSFQVSLSNWQLNPTFEAGFFAFTPPQGSQKIEFLAVAMANEKGKANPNGSPQTPQTQQERRTP